MVLLTYFSSSRSSSEAPFTSHSLTNSQDNSGSRLNHCFKLDPYTSLQANPMFSNDVLCSERFARFLIKHVLVDGVQENYHKAHYFTEEYRQPQTVPRDLIIIGLHNRELNNALSTGPQFLWHQFGWLPATLCYCI